KIAEECCDNENDKKVFSFISDIGRDTFTGGVVSGVVGELSGASSSLMKESFHESQAVYNGISGASAKRAANLVTKSGLLDSAGEILETGYEAYGHYENISEAS